MSTGKAALGYAPLSLLGDIGAPPELPGDGTLCLASLLVLAGSTQDSAGIMGWHRREGMATMNEAGRCPSTLGLGMLQGWGSLRAVGLAGKTHGKCYNVTPGWTKAASHPAPTSPWRGTPNIFTWCCAHLPKPGFSPSSVGAGQQSQAEKRKPTSLPCWGTLWPSLGHRATPQPHVGEHCLDFTQSSQTCALREPISPAPCAPAS